MAKKKAGSLADQLETGRFSLRHPQSLHWWEKMKQERPDDFAELLEVRRRFHSGGLQDTSKARIFRACDEALKLPVKETQFLLWLAREEDA